MVFLVFVGFKIIHPLFEAVLLLFVGILLLIILLDTLRIIPLRDFFGTVSELSSLTGTNLLQEFSTLLTLNQNYSKSLYQLMITQIKSNENNIKSFIINLNYLDYSNINLELIELITKNGGSKIKNLFRTIHELEKIDFKQMISQLPLFIDNYSSIEQYYQRKSTLIKTEKRKTYFIILLNSFSLGILSSILPFLFYINSFSLSIIKNTKIWFKMNPTIEVIIPCEFLLLVLILYTIYYKVYYINSIQTYIYSLIIILFLFCIGFLFCILLLRPTIVLF